MMTMAARTLTDGKAGSCTISSLAGFLLNCHSSMQSALHVAIWTPPRHESGQGYTASDNAQQSFQDSGAIIPYARMHVFICDPLPDPKNLAGCLLSKLKVHIQVL